MSKFRIEVLEKDYPYQEITELLHASYREHLDAGRKYLAATQTIEDTKRRVDGNYCVVAYNEEDKLVATVVGRVVCKADNEPRKWYQDKQSLYIEQMAVHPDYRDSNVLAKLVMKVMRLDIVRNADSWMSDTAVSATELVNSYVSLGFQIVDMISWETTNYYSYVFRKAVNGPKYSDSFVKRKFFFSSLKCRLMFRRDGKRRFGK